MRVQHSSGRKGKRTKDTGPVFGVKSLFLLANVLSRGGWAGTGRNGPGACGCSLVRLCGCAAVLPPAQSLGRWGVGAWLAYPCSLDQRIAGEALWRGV